MRNLKITEIKTDTLSDKLGLFLFKEYKLCSSIKVYLMSFILAINRDFIGQF